MALCLSFFSLLAFWIAKGSGMRTAASTKNTTAKMPMAIHSAGAASLIVALAALPIR